MNARIDPMTVMPELVTLENKADESDVLVQVVQGKMTLGTLVQHAEQLQSSGHLVAASNLYKLWIKHTEDDKKHFAFFNLGSLMQTLSDLGEARQAYESALKLQPDFAQAQINLGLVHEKSGHPDQAIRVWAALAGQRYLTAQFAPEMLTTALNHIGRLQENQKNYKLAMDAMEQSLLINPKQPGVIQHWLHIRQKSCEWPVYKELPNISANEMMMATSPLAMLALTEDPLQQLLCSHAFVARTYGLKEEFLCKGKSYQHDKVRVGYVSGDFREHAVGFLLPTFLQSHDRECYELYAFDFTQDDGSQHRQDLLKQFDHVCDVRAMSDRQAAETILKHEIDILIDLHGLSAGARPGIFALHPAPKQGTYIGFIGTTGMPWFDFVLADKRVLPPELALYFTEKPLYVDGTFIPLTAPKNDLPTVHRADVHLPENAFVMGAFGNVYKITPDMFASWMRLLHRIPNSVLWLIDDNSVTTANLKKQISKAKGDLSRVIFTARTGHDEFCARLKLCDVYLDTYPYNCGSTTNDVVQAGVPMVTMYGRTMVSRMGLSILTEVGESCNAVDNIAHYEERVFAISKNLCFEPKKYDLNCFNNGGLKIYQALRV